MNAADHGHHGPCDRRIEVYAETSASHAHDATLRMPAADRATKTTSGTLGRGGAKLLKGRARLEYLRKHGEPGAASGDSCSPSGLDEAFGKR